MGTSEMPSGRVGSGWTWQGASTRGARLGLGAAATVLLAGSTFAAMAMDGSANDVAPSARLSAGPDAPVQHAPQPAAPSSAAVAIPAAPVVDLGPTATRDHARSTAGPAQDTPAPHVSSTKPDPQRPVGQPSAVAPVDHSVATDGPAQPDHHVDRPQPHGTTSSDRYRAQARQQVRDEMRQEARQYMAEHWHMPMTR